MPAFPSLVFMYLTECIIVFSYGSSIYKARSKFSIVISVCLYAGLMLIYRYLTSQEAFNLLFTLICNILCLFACFKSSFKSSLFHGTVLVIAQFVSEVIAVYAISYLTEASNDSYAKNIEIYMTDVLVSKILYFTISRFLVKISVKEDSKRSWGRWFLLSVLPISSFFVVLGMRIITNGLYFSLYESVICIASLSLLLIANIVVYSIYEKAEKSNQKLIELELTNQKNEIDMQYLGLLEKKNQTMNIMIHDYKNHMMTLSDMSNSPEIKDYINNMLGEITKYNQVGKTQNKLLDVVLSKYTDICKECGIKFETNVISDNLSFINTYDLSALFNNVLDNAVDAASKSREKFIYLEIANSLGSYHKITVINSSDIKPVIKNDKLITTKQNKDAHGIGTKSIWRTTKKYNGELQWEYNNKDKQFKLVILFPDE